MPAKPETRLVKRIVEALEKEFGGLWHKQHGNIFSGRGHPDITGCCPLKLGYNYAGIYVAIEVKMPDEDPKPIQLYRIEKITMEGGIAFWTTSPESAITELRLRLDHIKDWQ